MASLFSKSEDRDQTIVIRRYMIESEAQLISVYLRKAGIPNFLSNTYMNQMIPFGQGGIGLHIYKSDKSTVERLLSSLQELPEITEDDLLLDLENGHISLDPGIQTTQRNSYHWLIYFTIILLILGFLIHALLWSNSPFKIW
jgi:hypothetical protein